MSSEAEAKAAMKRRAVAILTADNPRKADAVAIYADAWIEYQEAQRNIDEHGAVVFHPRTGAPIENPYLAARNRASALMLKIKLRTDRLWALVAS
jgi:phage terminase small subunit